MEFHRRNLPHLYDSEGIYFVTYRLADSIPLSALRKLPHRLLNNDFTNYKKLFIKYDSLLDSNLRRTNYLINKELAGICRTTLEFPDNKEYKLICYTIMPNHIHLVFELLPNNRGISKIMQGIKGTSARKCNSLLNRTGKFWQDESYDRLIRDDIEFYFTVNYVLLNPVKAGLANKWNEWEYTYCHPTYLTI